MELKTTSEILTPDQLADWIQVSPKWVTRYTQERRIPGQFKAGKYWRYDKAAIEKQKLATKEILLPKRAR